MKTKKLTWILRPNDGKILLEVEREGKISINSRWNDQGSATCYEAIGTAMRRALSSRFDYGNTSVKLFISGGEMLTGCYLECVTIKI